MTHRGMKFLVCPACKKRGVYLRFGSEDWWVCRYCRYDEDGWSGACNYGHDTADLRERQRLSEANPEADVWVSDYPLPAE